MKIFSDSIEGISTLRKPWFLIFVVVTSYILIIIYTLAYDFIPIVNIYTLPIMLIMLPVWYLLIIFVYVMSFMMVLLIVGAPVFWFNRDIIARSIYLKWSLISDEDPTSTEILSSSLPIQDLFCYLVEQEGRKVALSRIGGHLLVTITTSFLFAKYIIQFILNFGLNNFIQFLLAAFLGALFVTGVSIDSLIKKRILLTLFIIISIAIGSFKHTAGGLVLIPNETVKYSLSTAGLGGELVVGINRKKQTSNYENLGRLLLYDGKTAWIKSCDYNSIVMVIINVEDISYLPDEECLRSAN